MDFLCCLYKSGGKVRENKNNRESRGDRVVGGGCAIVYRVLNKGRQRPKFWESSLLN